MFIEKKDGVQNNQEIFPFEMGYLPEFFQKKAETELRDTTENREKGLKLIREMARKDKHLTGLEFDEDFLLQYLRCRKYNVAHAFSKLKAFVILKKMNPEMFNGFRFETLSLATRNKILTFLPKRCLDGCSVCIVLLDNWIPEQFPVEEIKRTAVIYLLQALRDPMTQVNGFKFIFDVKSNPIRHIRYCTPSNIYLLAHDVQECMGGRVKEIHFVNNSLTFKAAWAIVKHFLPEKLRKRVFYHAGYETLLRLFPSSILPVECGGDVENLDMSEWLRKVTQPERLATLGGRVVANK